MHYISFFINFEEPAMDEVCFVVKLRARLEKKLKSKKVQKFGIHYCNIKLQLFESEQKDVN